MIFATCNTEDHQGILSSFLVDMDSNVLSLYIDSDIFARQHFGMVDCLKQFKCKKSTATNDTKTNKDMCANLA